MAHLNRTVKVRIFKASRYIQNKYDEDLVNLIKKYNSEGYRDAIVLRDSVSGILMAH
jgi:outer membrane protein insertion porin family